LRIGLPLVPHGLALIGISLADRFVIEGLGSTRDVGRYQVAYAVGSLVMMLTAGAANAWTPFVFGSGTEARWSNLARSAAGVQALGVLGVALIALLSPFLLPIAAPAEYETDELVPVVAVVALATLPYIHYMGVTMVPQWTGATRALAWMSVVALLVNVGLAIALYDALGLTGVAAATFAAYFVEAGMVYAWAARLAPVPWRAREGILLAAVALLACTAGAFLPADGWSAAVRVLVLLICAGAVATSIPWKLLRHRDT
jgi:O-antigen/teichoic acid export membrane protein